MNSGQRNGIIKMPKMGPRPTGSQTPKGKGGVTNPTSKKTGYSKVINPTHKRAC